MTEKRGVKRSGGNAARSETIRNRLALSQGEFARALGLSPSGYSRQVADDQVSDTVALAAEALARRQAQEDGELAFMVRIVRGVPQVTMLDSLERMTFVGKSYLLVPISPPKAPRRQEKTAPVPSLQSVTDIVTDIVTGADGPVSFMAMHEDERLRNLPGDVIGRTLGSLINKKTLRKDGEGYVLGDRA